MYDSIKVLKCMLDWHCITFKKPNEKNLLYTQWKSRLKQLYGAVNLKNMQLKYVSFMRENHLNFDVRDSGFYISIKKSFLGASPDSSVSCECCGEGCLEVKCLCSYKDKFITEWLTDKNTCLNKTKNGEIQIWSEFSQMRHFGEQQFQNCALNAKPLWKTQKQKITKVYKLLMT